MKHLISEFSVEVNDIITPLSCSTMIVEFIKYIIYQKELIPYPFERLKMYVDKRRKQLENSSPMAIDNNIVAGNRENTKYILASDKYFKKTREACDSLENIFKIITDEITSVSFDHVDEVVIMLGSSFMNPQDVFRLCVPALSYSHSMEYHPTKKNCRSLYKTMFRSEKFHNLISNTICNSNLHIFLKMKPVSFPVAEYLIPRNGYNLPSRGTQALINFNTLLPSNCSCSDSSTFESSRDNATSTDDTHQKMKENDSSWFQVKDTLKQFSDVQFKGRAITDLWMNPQLLESL